MKIPHPRTIAYRIVHHILDHEKCTQASLIEEIGAPYNRQNVVKAIHTLRSDGALIAPESGRIMPNAELTLSDEMRALLDDELEGKQVYRGIVAPPAVRNVFATTLDPKKLPSVLGMREGSNEYRNWPSKYN